MHLIFFPVIPFPLSLPLNHWNVFRVARICPTRAEIFSRRLEAENLTNWTLLPRSAH